MEWIADPSIWAGLITLVVIELVLGIDNLVFIAILAEKLPPLSETARVTGLLLAMVMRLLLLASISWLVTLTKPLITWHDLSFSARDLIMLFGGLFLLSKPPLSLMNGWRKDSNNPTQRKARNSGELSRKSWCWTLSSPSTRLLPRSAWLTIWR